MKKSEVIALGVVAVECVIIGVFEFALKKRVDKILDDDGSGSIDEYLRKKSQEIYRKKSPRFLGLFFFLLLYLI